MFSSIDTHASLSISVLFVSVAGATITAEHIETITTGTDLIYAASLHLMSHSNLHVNAALP
jgi:hypothetical protein